MMSGVRAASLRSDAFLFAIYRGRSIRDLSAHRFVPCSRAEASEMPCRALWHHFFRNIFSVSGFPEQILSPGADVPHPSARQHAPIFDLHKLYRLS